MTSSTLEFINKAKAIHAEKYSYELVSYINSKDKVSITCKEHGIFLQTPNNHLNNHGCPHCCGLAKKDTDCFIRDAVKTHGHRFDYSKAKYVNSMTKLDIICPVHGDFQQLPPNHVRGEGCPRCSGSGSHNRASWIMEAKRKHGNRYDYSSVFEYKYGEKLTIICHIHGPFDQDARSHLRGIGCPRCGLDQMDTVSFIERSKLVHAERYDYNTVVYNNSYTKVRIKCREHGHFEQAPSSHLIGNGCPRCVGRNKDTETFVAECRQVHGNLYDYSAVIYKTNKEKVQITCTAHGIFQQTPGNHLRGSGCPKCSRQVSKKERKFLDLVGIPEDCRQVTVDLGVRRLKVDGIDLNTTPPTIYEFDGDFWHGNLNRYSEFDLNRACKKTFGELNSLTEKRNEDIKSAGYQLFQIWESDLPAFVAEWNQQNKTNLNKE